MEKIKNRIVKLIKSQLAKNPGITAEQVSKNIDCSVNTVRQYAWKNGIKFEGHIYKVKVKKAMHERMKKIEKLIEEDPFYSSAAIAEKVGLTRGRVLVLLETMGYKRKWERRDGNGDKRTSDE